MEIAHIEDERKEKMNEMESRHATGRTDWETPPEFFKIYDDVYHFTLDVCADEKNHKVAKYFTKEQDGLKQSWVNQICWCNPPYGRGVIGKWVEKAWMESRYATIVMLLPARTSTDWFHRWIYKQRFIDIDFLRGRLRFVGAASSAMFPSMVVTFHMTNP